MPRPGSGQALVRVFGSSVNPVNVALVEPICENFGYFLETIGTYIAGVIVAVGEECNLMYVLRRKTCGSAAHSRVR